MSVFYFRLTAIVFFCGAVLISLKSDLQSDEGKRLIRLAAIIILLLKGGEYLYYAIVGQMRIPAEFSAMSYFFYAAVALLDKRKKLYPMASFCSILAGIVYAVGSLFFAEKFVLGAENAFTLTATIIAHNALLLGGLLMLKSSKFPKNAFLQMAAGGTLFLCFCASVCLGVGNNQEVFLMRALDTSIAKVIFSDAATWGAMEKSIYYFTLTFIFLSIMAIVYLVNGAVFKRITKRNLSQRQNI